ncbi:MAG: metallophosphoesterase [Treponema sp.]|nr:metallophosphoesterase [Treponema sp.]MCL2237340.1 metallophosphoesterase [Treponema sp.]
MDSKKLLVFSDTHGCVPELKAVLKWACDYIPPNGSICAVACCGDGLSDIPKAANESGFFSDWKIVCGNNDYDVQAPESIIFDINEHIFFMSHGHRYGLYGGYHTFLSAAKNMNADAALFGHSHIPFYKVIDGISLVNPGSLGRPRSKAGSTFAVIECKEDEPIKVEFFEIGNKGKIKSVKI